MSVITDGLLSNSTLLVKYLRIVCYNFGSNFGNKIRLHIWTIRVHDILYEVDTHIEYLKLQF